MEYNWERTIPFLQIDRNKVNTLFEGILDKDSIMNITPISEGCRTTNYIVETTDKKYILKIFFSTDETYKKEYNLLKMIEKELPVQKVYKISNNSIINEREYAIYNYIEGKTLGQALKDGYILNEDLVKEVARTLANIHSYKFNKIGFLDSSLNVKDQLPPLNKWYEMFINERVEQRLGIDVVNTIRTIVKNNSSILIELDEDPRLIHGDFQGTNILICDGHLSGILDWEFTMSGHPLADIGQFFRYEQYFNEKFIKIFKLEYDKHSNYKLMDDWYKISKLRDLVNLIQLISGEEDMPNKYKNIKEIIMKNLQQF